MPQQRHEVPLVGTESLGGGGWGQTARNEPSGGVVPSRFPAPRPYCVWAAGSVRARPVNPSSLQTRPSGDEAPLRRYGVHPPRDGAFPYPNSGRSPVSPVPQGHPDRVPATSTALIAFHSCRLAPFGHPRLNGRLGILSNKPSERAIRSRSHPLRRYDHIVHLRRCHAFRREQRAARSASVPPRPRRPKSRRSVQRSSCFTPWSTRRGTPA